MTISLETLSKQVRDVLAYSQGYDKAVFSRTPMLIHQWWENKARFFPYLNDNLIWEGPSISLDYTPTIKKAMFDQFIDSARDYLLSDRAYDSNIDDWCEWLEDNANGFFDNIVTSPFPDTDMKQGMKLIKSFKFFDFDGSTLRYLQDLASQYIQKNKIEGILCISVHPLDYLSLSDNNANWRSCHALDGEFRAGNLSYMLDKTSVVCYIKSKEEVQLERFPDGMLWNNKKWRVLLHIHEKNNIAYVNRQYPFSCTDFIHKLMDTPFMRAMNLDCHNSSYFRETGFRKIDDTTFNQNYFIMQGFILDPQEMCAGDDQSLQYNDFVFSPHYTPEFIMPHGEWFFFYSNSGALKREFSVPIGVRVLCPGCGKNMLGDSCSFLCEDCQDEAEGVIGICDCGSRIYEGDHYGTGTDGTIYCEDCAKRLKEQGEEIEME